MKKPTIDWQKEFEAFSKSGLSQPQYCKERRLKYTTFRYHWERRFKNQNEDGFVEVPNSVVNVSSASGSEFLILKIDSSGKAHLQMNLQLSLGIWS
ncbi:IS66 family insertion sequence element accessory protein TnpA [Leptospira interrogans]|uniref:Transposase n=1 Tax=Leptospira interrogans TaxID=173 RepID=A0AAV9FXB9_LEPIR|nr:hypothetical protein [Leptospira interrogans]KAK2617351.1 hypothetical protein CFV95_020465 [Leptospira interrogans]KAK2620547.1 hypothetical protein CFV95_016820 [Leptospira interrogans]KAK2620550.1 hypothetical protein CFV95_016835 [Leptospira interrogans]KAK2620849.1 hypothetical protein CFV95_018475 [Leptospira interrogans]KAK2620856.1 hypothetical protein CFV95_018510 [Leptospira interrogans]